MLGRVHSIESFGTVDGPGTRYVVFLKGCPMRCKYCHNPDTWDSSGGRLMSAEEILEDYLSKKEFYKTGGITCSGGEPLLQLEFVIELFKKAKQLNIHTCLDTSGVCYPIRENFDTGSAWYSKYEYLKERYLALFEVTDLVLLDIKHSDEEGHRELTKHSLKPVIQFLSALNENNVSVSIRHVVVPEITFNKKELRGIGKIMSKYKNIVGLEVLPYHTMGINKYRELEIEYPLEGVRSLTKEEARAARDLIIKTMIEERAKG